MMYGVLSVHPWQGGRRWHFISHLVFSDETIEWEGKPLQHKNMEIRTSTCNCQALERLSKNECFPCCFLTNCVPSILLMGNTVTGMAYQEIIQNCGFSNSYRQISNDFIFQQGAPQHNSFRLEHSLKTNVFHDRQT